MGAKSIISKALHGLSFIIHGQPSPIYANITYLKPNERLAGKRIIVTGGGRGLGYAMAERFAAEGAKVLIAGRNIDTLKKSAEAIGCQYLPLDVQDVTQFADFIEKAYNMLGGLNCLVNNAGISLHEQDIFHVSEDQFDAQISTNFRGPYFLSQAFMDKCGTDNTNQTKKILFVSSETGITVDERPYGLTKAAVNSLVQGLAHKYVKQGFHINAIAPGVTISDMVGKTDDGNLRYGDGRYFLPAEVAEVACFLLSEASNCVNGQIVVCNEGKTINARWR